MGGHGGLNILPQKRWNVYGRENRLKVARDEAKYEEEQAAIRERAEEADRERRRQLLKERARQRYGDQQQLLGPADGVAGALEPPQQQEQQQLEWRQPPAADYRQTDGAALRGLAAGQADHFAALEQQQQQQRPQKERSGREPEKKRRREQRRGADGPPPTLAHLAAQLEGPPAADPAAAGGAASGGGGAGGVDGAGLQRFSLFAEEEALAAKRKNPEVEAEKRDERRRRGDPNTQTSDARFDEQFGFAHKLYGQAAVPWYAKRGSTLPSHDGEADQQRAEPSGGRRQMWQWEMQARAALAGAGPLHQGGGPQGQQGQGHGLLAGVKVLPDGGATRRRDQAAQSNSSTDSSSTDSSSSSSDSSSSDSSSSSDGSRRHRRRNKRRSGRRDKHGKVSKRSEKSKRRRRERRGGKGAAADGSKAGVEELRLERLRREEAERARQQRVLAVAAGRDPALAGKRYHQGYGFGRQ